MMYYRKWDVGDVIMTILLAVVCAPILIVVGAVKKHEGMLRLGLGITFVMMIGAIFVLIGYLVS